MTSLAGLASRFESWSPRARAGLLALISLAVYASSLGNGFVWDDTLLIVDNQHITDLSNLDDFFTSSASQSARDLQFYRPLRAALFALEYQIWGLSPLGYHAVNVALHAAVNVAVYALLLALGLGPGAAFFAALLSGVHPLNVEAVANVTGRTDLLFALFYVLALRAHVRGRGAIGRAQTSGLYLLALLSKEMAISLPLAAVLADVFRGCAEQGSAIAVAKEKLRDYAALAGASVLFLLVRHHATSGGRPLDYYYDSAWVTLLSQCHVYLKYLALVAFPYPLSARYDLHLIHTPLHPSVVGFGALLAVLLVATYRQLVRGRLPLGLFGAWFFLVSSLPVSNAVPIPAAMMGDRYLYLPKLGLVVLGLAVVQGRWAAGPRRLALLGAALALGFSVHSSYRCTVWRDEMTLFEDARSQAPNTLAVRWRLFGLYRAAGRQREAAEEYEAVLRINHRAAMQHLSRAVEYRSQGRIEDARRMAQRALRTKPTLVEAQRFLAELPP